MGNVNFVIPAACPYTTSNAFQCFLYAINKCSEVLQPSPIARAGIDVSGELFVVLEIDMLPEDLRQREFRFHIDDVARGLVRYSGVCKLLNREGIEDKEALAKAFILGIPFYVAGKYVLYQRNILDNAIVSSYPTLAFLSDSARLGVIVVYNERGKPTMTCAYLLSLDEGEYKVWRLDSTSEGRVYCKSHVSIPFSRNLVKRLAEFIYDDFESSKGSARHQPPFFQTMFDYHQRFIEAFVAPVFERNSLPPPTIEPNLLGFVAKRRDFFIQDVCDTLGYPVKFADRVLYTVSPLTEGMGLKWVLRAVGAHTSSAMLYHLFQLNVGSVLLLVVAASILRDVVLTFGRDVVVGNIGVSVFGLDYKSLKSKVYFQFTLRARSLGYIASGNPVVNYSITLEANDDNSDVFELSASAELARRELPKGVKISFNDALFISFVEQPTSPPTWVKTLQLLGVF